MTATTRRVFRRATQCMAALPILLGAVLALAPPESIAAGEPCGAAGQPACPVTARLPSCDYNLVETAGGCMRPACGAEGQAPCAANARVILDPVLKTVVPQPCDINLKAVGGVCVHPACGRLGQNPCPVWERIPSCDLDLVERPLKACERPACGRPGEAPCDVGTTALRQGRSCDVDLVARDGLCQRPVMPPSVQEVVRSTAQGAKQAVAATVAGTKKGVAAAAQGTKKAAADAAQATVGAVRGAKTATVGAVRDARAAAGGATLHTSAPVYDTSQLVVVQYSGMPGTKHDWVTIVPADAPNEAYGEWAWLGPASGTHRFGRLLKPGRYQVRAFENWPAGEFTIKGRVDFEVR